MNLCLYFALSLNGFNILVFIVIFVHFAVSLCECSSFDGLIVAPPADNLGTCNRDYSCHPMDLFPHTKVDVNGDTCVCLIVRK